MNRGYISGGLSFAACLTLSVIIPGIIEFLLEVL